MSSSKVSIYKARPAPQIHSTQVKTHQMRQRLDERAFGWLYWQYNTCMCTSFSFNFFSLIIKSYQWRWDFLHKSELIDKKNTRTKKGCRQNNNLSKKTLGTKIKRKEKIDNDHPIWLKYACRRTRTFFSPSGFKIELMVFLAKTKQVYGIKSEIEKSN